MLDYHVHPGYCIDAEPASIGEYCRRAFELGLKEICFTPHLEVDPVRKHLDGFVRLNGKLTPMSDLTWLDCYFKDVEEAVREWRPSGLSVKCGLEVGFDLGLENVIEKILSSYPFDFVLGSVHCLEHKAISSKKESGLYFSGRELKEVVSSYFHTLTEAVSSGLFDVIGHLDLYRRYGLDYYGESVLKAHEDLIWPLFELMLKSGAGLEINTSSLRRGQADFHPSRPIVEAAGKAGITVFTVGSDAHRLADLGCQVKEAQAGLNEIGVSPATYRRRQATGGKNVDKVPVLS